MKKLIERIDNAYIGEVSDFSEDDELEESKLLWENLVSDLKQVLGSA